MAKIIHMCFAAGLALGATSVLAQPAATVQLTSTRSGATIGWTQPVDWRVTISLAAGTSHGLAGFSVDLVQGPSNPSLIDIPPATRVPTFSQDPVDLNRFSRPLGISNPQPGNLRT